MTQNQRELRVEQINASTTNVVERLWQSLDLQSLTLEKQREVVQIRTDAYNLIQRVRLMLRVPDSNAGDQLLTMGQALNQKWERVQEIMASRYEYAAAKAIGSTDVTLQSDLERSLESVSAGVEEKSPVGNIVKEMGKIGERLVADVTEDSYLMQSSRGLIPNMGKIEKARTFLEKAIGTVELDTGIRSHAQKLLNALNALRSSAPKESEHADWYKEHFGQYKIDWRPLRGLGVAVGSIITALGLSQTIRGKGFSPATAFWAAIAGLSYNPNMFQSSGNAGLQKLEMLSNPDLRYAVCNGMHGEDGVRAFEELQDLSTDPEKKRQLQAMMAPDYVIESGNLASLLGGTNSIAYTILAKMKPEERKRTLLLLGKKKNDADKALITEYIRGA